ncbi:zinc-finger-containing protein [Methylobacterium sp. CM6257]
MSGRRTSQRSEEVVKPIPICPRCGQPATQTLKPTGLKSRCEPCGLWSRGSKPLRDEAGHRAHITRVRARRDAHLFFDPLWREGLLDRDTAYELLARELGIERDACHMSRMDFEVARRVPRAVKAIRAALAVESLVGMQANANEGGHDRVPSLDMN